MRPATHLQLLTEIRERGPADLVRDPALGVEPADVRHGVQERLRPSCAGPPASAAAAHGRASRSRPGSGRRGPSTIGRIRGERLGRLPVGIGETQQAVLVSSRHSPTVTDRAGQRLTIYTVGYQRFPPPEHLRDLVEHVWLVESPPLRSLRQEILIPNGRPGLAVALADPGTRHDPVTRTEWPNAASVFGIMTRPQVIGQIGASSYAGVEFTPWGIAALGLSDLLVDEVLQFSDWVGEGTTAALVDELRADTVRPVPRRSAGRLPVAATRPGPAVAGRRGRGARDRRGAGSYDGRRRRAAERDVVQHALSGVPAEPGDRAEAVRRDRPLLPLRRRAARWSRGRSGDVVRVARVLRPGARGPGLQAVHRCQRDVVPRRTERDRRADAWKIRPRRRAPPTGEDRSHGTNHSCRNRCRRPRSGGGVLQQGLRLAGDAGAGAGGVPARRDRCRRRDRRRDHEQPISGTAHDRVDRGRRPRGDAGRRAERVGRRSGRCRSCRGSGGSATRATPRAC